MTINHVERTPLEVRSDGLSVTQAAEKLGMHRQTIYGWIKDRRLPVTRFGSGPRPIVRIHPDDLARVAGPRA